MKVLAEVSEFRFRLFENVSVRIGILPEAKELLVLKMLEALKGCDKTDHLRVNVSGHVEGDTIKVTSVKLL